MAGHIENSPYTLNFQADTLHSGSISFGRFENEALCWERRSSFSHNRYLEDAEKYSRPGSVNEKKAYFEAHFRRRALMKQASSGSQNGTDYQSSENDFSETMSCEYDNFGSFRERSHSARFDGYPVSEIEFGEQYSATDPQNEPQCVRPNSECDTSKCDHENMQELQHDEVGNVQTNNEPEIETLNSEVGKFDMSWKASNVSSNCHLVEKNDSINSEHQISDTTCDVVDLSASHPHGETVTNSSLEHPDDASTEEMTATSRRERASRSKEMKSDRKVAGTQGRIDTSNVECWRAKSNVESRKATPNVVVSKNLVGRPTKKESNDLLRLKREKKKAESASPVTKPKQEVPHNSKTKPLHLNRSADLESRTRRTIRSSSSENVAPKLNSTVNRPSEAFGLSRSRMKHNDSAFNFKSDERAEKRKQFIIKLEKKIHTKEAEMHQIQAMKQEKIVSEIKQLRKRLNFKATPMPTFYHESDHGIEKAKGTPRNVRSSRPVRRNSVAGNETCERSPSCSVAGSVRVSSACEPLNKSRPQHGPEVTSFQRAATPKSSSRSAAPGHKTHAQTAKKELKSERHQNTQHKDAASIGKVSNKTTKVEDEPEPKSNRSGTRGTRKEMRGGGFGSSVRFGHLAVSMASGIR